MRVRLLVLVLFLVGCLAAGAVAQSPAGPESCVAGEPGCDLAAAPGCPSSAPPMVLSAEEVTQAGLATTIVEHASGTRRVRAFGRVLDPLPLIQAVHTVDAARSALALARSEDARVSMLHADDRNASTRDLENADAVLERATLDFSDAMARCALSWGSATARRDDLGVLADNLVGARSAVARLDLPAGETVPSPPEAIALSSVDGDVRCSARLLGPAPTTDPLLQGQAYLYLIERDPPPPGTSLLATLSRDEPVRAGVSVPRSAVVWDDGKPLVYVELASGVFKRRRVGLHVPLGDAWLVTSGVTAGDHVVVQGAQQLLSKELLAVLPVD